jgi:hypothetical protein
MRHTPASIRRLIESDEMEVVFALKAIARINGFGCGGKNFGTSLVKWINDGKRLTERQLFAARNMIVGSYLAVLANAANAKSQEKDYSAGLNENEREERDYRDGWASQENANFIQDANAEPQF